MNNFEILITIILVSIVTYLLRLLPFLMVKKKQLSLTSTKIIDMLPSATISLLVIYSLKDTNSTNVVPTVVALSILVIIHKWKRNAILSIVVSTAVYMFLLQQFA